MEARPLQIRIIKADDLKDVNFMTKMDVYAVVSISGDQMNNRKQKTTVDKVAGTNPKWDFPMEFTVDDAAVQENRLTLKIKLVSNRSLGDREIGVVYVQIKELFDATVHRDGDGEKDGGAAVDEEKSGSYSVRLSNGKAKGTLDLAYKFGEKYKIESPPFTAEPYAMKGLDAPPIMAYPPTFPGSSSSYPPPPPGGYPYPPPPHSGAPYHPPAAAGYGYPPPPPGYGYGGYPPPPPGYGYPPMQPPQNPKKSGGGGMGLGLGAGLLGGLLIGDMMTDL